MKKINTKMRADEQGLSLVEVLASTVLITLLLSTFLMMFAQAARTNVASENIVDGTYIAQTEMEKIFEKSKTSLTSTRKAAIIELGYLDAGTSPEWLKFRKDSPNAGEEIQVRLENKEGKTARVIIEVIDKPKGTSRAKMENVLVWEAAS